MNTNLIILILLPLTTFGQVTPSGSQFPNTTTIPQTPKPSSLGDLMNNNNTNQQNKEAMQRMGHQQVPTQTEIKTNNYVDPFKARKDLTEVEKLKLELYSMKETEQRLNFSVPSYENVYPEQTQPFRSAYDSLNEMITGEEPTNIAKAIFLTENAYMGNTQNYEAYDRLINEIADFCMEFMKAKGYDTNSNLAKNMMLYRILADTLELHGKKHLPVEYDFEDYWGREDWTKMFITKLLRTNSGQCHSMPLLYLAVADRIGAEAFLSFAPSHSYIKFRDKYNNWYNVELTNGRLTSDAFIMGSGYIKTEAIRSGIYMDTIGTKKVLAHIMTDLSKGYQLKFGMDKFAIDMINRSLEVFPNNIYALQQKSDYYTVMFAQFMQQVPKPYPSVEELKIKYPPVYDAYTQRNAMYDMIDEIGYEPMPDEVYRTWLKSVDEEKNRLQHDEQEKKIMKVIDVYQDR